MSFYSSIVKGYDEIFPLNKAQADFIESIFPVLYGKKILDAGCGTGSLAIEMGRRSARVEAFDLDDAMILKAKEKCPQAIDVHFSKNNLLTFGKDYVSESFDLVYCLGNTLAHLSCLEDVRTYVDAVTGVLKPGGYALIQVVNYDRVINNKITQLPTIESDNYVFERNYIPESHGIIQFSTILKNKQTDEQYAQSVPLIPILKNDLDHLLSSEFTNIRYVGSFKKEEWSDEAFHTVVIAQKRTGQNV